MDNSSRGRGGRRSRSPRNRLRSRQLPLRTGGILLVAAGLLISGCSNGSSPADASLASLSRSTPAELAPFYGQKLSWRDCGAPGFQCASLKVPLDYAKPAAGDIRLAVSRKQATKKKGRLGSLLVNPGGPGGSAIGYLQSYAALGYPAAVRARYDMVAVDPRGVARSEPVTCLEGERMDAWTQTDVTPDDRREADALRTAFQSFASGCEERSAKVLPHVSTVETARDMDVLRSVLGDDKLTYVGASYGTFLGATYAELYPERVGRLVLDGAMDPSLPARRMNRDQTAGFETAFRSFAKDCATKGEECPLGAGSPEDAGKRLKAFFGELDRQPLLVGGSGGRRLGEALATTGVIAAMYDEAGWPQLRDALTSAMKNKDGSGLLALSDGYYERDGDGKYANLMFANAAVNCLDLPPAFASPAEVRKGVASFREASPVFGEGLAWSSLNCAYWPVRATGEAHRIEAKGAAPILVAGTTRDPATPYRWAKALASQLSSGRLLTYEGDGHTAYGRGSECVDSTINAYLLEGTVPEDGKRCS
ncbi:alpha/beta fold hydrolase [Streptomyces sp. SID335]|uniref:alpha/beta hydrolase n=1 Tax=unclassified Streptomyces TaxID=2593676 RepID=UPI00136EBCD3|nr:MULTISPECIES: alpha/beta hydrolase [unclassified Streptomyces]MYY86644.1 alpha/beta fold hydrolase [Streptomyces sp. SID335]NDZ85870.1 alpha/beta hydrolase [Streptomyces sp. SID10115]NDZ99856.1 alpha/beta hydrolase [Streptomyces sp. SID10116]NEB49228.1 alpha/beta hydrolase [Streptomyces sp. SID339]